MLVHKTNVLRLRNIPLLVICTLFINGHIFTFKHLCLHSITKILRNGPKAHFPFNTHSLTPLAQLRPCIALRNMSIGDVCPQETEEPSQAQDQPSSSIQASPPTRDEELAQEEEDQVQDNEPPQEEGIDQGRDEVDQEMEDEQEIQDQRPPHPRVHQEIQ
jgi:hypothetical protein